MNISENYKFLDVSSVEQQYKKINAKLNDIKQKLNKKHLTLAEKVLFSHLSESYDASNIKRGESMLKLNPDRCIMQDATAQMAILQFMQSGRQTVSVPSSVHCDHLIRAESGANDDLKRACNENREVYDFLSSAAMKYGMGFWGPGSGIIHQVVLEKYAYPGQLIIGTDSHTPNAGGLGMLAIGVGGADVADVMAGLDWEVRMPELIGVKLTGKLSGWASPKDIILYLCGLLTTKGGTNKIIEYFGEGVHNFSTTGKATITNMGAELGATTSIFPTDKRSFNYLKATGREDIANIAEQYINDLNADAEVWENPAEYYDRVIEINLDELEPYIVGPHSPDKARPLSEFKKDIQENDYPIDLSAALIGSCTNSSYEDMERAASLARQASERNIKAKSQLLITPGSDQVHETIKRDGQLDDFTKIGGVVLANACGPCIGNWDRKDIKQGDRNAIISSFNRNFPKRNDGNAETLSFIASPEIVLAMALAGRTDFNPLTDELEGKLLNPPVAPELPEQGFVFSALGYQASPEDRSSLQVQIDPKSHRLEILEPFAQWNGEDFVDIPVLVKTQGQTTTDHISPAGRYWLPLRGHLSGISHNMLHGAVDAETSKVADTIDMEVCGMTRPVSPWALKALGIQENKNTGFVIIGDENYGEGSSREHAAMSPRKLGAKAVIAKSFARIHETNLKKQGVLPLHFINKDDYSQVSKDDSISIINLDKLTPNQPVEAIINGKQTISLKHTLTAEQINWFKAGSAMNSTQNK